MNNSLTVVDDPDSKTRPSCPNCEATINGEFCYKCGQSQKRFDRFFLTLVMEAFEDVFSWDSKSARSIVALLFKPGFLTNEYFMGRRVRYLPPLRLYLFSSILFFLLLSLQGNTNVYVDNIPEDINNPPESVSSETDIETNKNSIRFNDKTAAETEKDIMAAIDRLEISWLNIEQNENIRSRLRPQAKKTLRTIEDDPGEIIDAFLDIAPLIMFILLPLFALLMKVFYITSGKYYTEHLVLAVHNHSFLFVIFIFTTLIDALTSYSPTVMQLINVALYSWIPVYLYISLKKIFREGHFFTATKYLVLSVSYLILFFSVFAVGSIAGLMTL